MLGSHGKPPKVETTQHLADRTFSHDDAEFLLDLIRQINPPPANNAVLIHIRALPHPLRYDGLLLDRQQRRGTRGLPV